MRNKAERFLFVYSLFLICFFMSLTMFTADSVADALLFQQANDLYENQKYADALKLYKKIEKKDPSVWYNMGNTLYQMQEGEKNGMTSYQDAAVAWECARNQSFYSDCQDCSDNIILVGKKIKWPNSVPEISDRNLYREKIIAGHSLLFYQMWFLFFWYLFLFLFACCVVPVSASVYILGFKHRLVRYSLLFLMVAMTIVFGSWLRVKQKQITQRSAVVFADKALLFFGPSHDYHTMCTIGCAEKMTILDKHNQWFKVNYKNKIGWILGDSVELI